MRLKVTQIHSTIGRKEDQKRTAVALGLGRIGKVRVHEDNPVIRGMINKITHLLKVEEVDLPLGKLASQKRSGVKPTGKKIAKPVAETVAKEDGTKAVEEKSEVKKKASQKTVAKKKPAAVQKPVAKKVTEDTKETSSETK